MNPKRKRITLGHGCVISLRKALEPFASEFKRRMAHAARNSSARRSWNERMPDKFPITIKVTMGDCREACRVLEDSTAGARLGVDKRKRNVQGANP